MVVSFGLPLRGLSVSSPPSKKRRFHRHTVLSEQPSCSTISEVDFPAWTRARIDSLLEILEGVEVRCGGVKLFFLGILKTKKQRGETKTKKLEKNKKKFSFFEGLLAFNRKKVAFLRSFEVPLLMGGWEGS